MIMIYNGKDHNHDSMDTGSIEEFSETLLECACERHTSRPGDLPVGFSSFSSPSSSLSLVYLSYISLFLSLTKPPASLPFAVAKVGTTRAGCATIETGGSVQHVNIAIWATTSAMVPQSP